MTLRPLMSAAQIAKELQIEERTAENMFQAIAREHGGPVVVKGMDGEKIVRNIFVERAWVDAAIGQRAS